MAVAPNHKKLIIPKKQMPKAHAGYSDDMRTIEQWANDQVNGVSQLIAGTNITLDPTSGEGVVTINASGGGGGGAPGFLELIAGPDISTINAEALMLGPSNQQGPGVVAESVWPLFSNASGSDQTYQFVPSWFVIASGGTSIVFLPQVTAPAFTGGTGDISIQFIIECASTDWSNFAEYSTGATLLASGATLQPPITDYSIVNTASDIVLTAGPGFSGNGLVTQGSGLPYLASTSLYVTVPTGTTFS